MIRLIALLIIVVLGVPRVASASLAQPTNTMEASIRSAILRGDAQELRMLLEQAGKLSANDSAIAQRALASMETLGAQDARMLAGRYGIDWANKVQHALKTAADGHVKRALFERYKTAEAIFARLDRAIGTLRNLPDGFSNQTVVVDGIEVIVRCFVNGGAAIISTIEKR